MQSTTIIYKTQDSKEFRIPGSVGALVSSSTSSPPGASASSTTTTTTTATTMRPPPPPGPPKTKDNKPERGHEEPSSSIPDLGSIRRLATDKWYAVIKKNPDFQAIAHIDKGLTV
ncbi:hypothetical protein Trydic_g17775 [Trypoxylus dichotomus]